MVRKGLVAAVVIALIALPALGLFSQTASAANELYVIAEEKVDVYLLKDGSADIKYQLHITVRPQSDTVDSFKVHLPNWRFSESSLSASIDGETIVGVAKSKDNENEVSITLNSREAMEPGTSHLFLLVVNVGAMAVKHPSDPDMARVSFTPTWWNPKKVQEVQVLKVHIHLPTGYLDAGNIDHTKGANVTEVNERLMLSWEETDLAADEKRTFRADFPASTIDNVSDPFWDIQFHYYQNYILIVVIVVMVAIAVVVVKRALRRPYIKPYMTVEAWGARKGLGPLEAALVLKRKRSRIACMFLMDLVMVGAVEIEDTKDMRIKVVNPEYGGRAEPFLNCIREGRVDPIVSSNLIASMGDEVNAKLVDYDGLETKAHYKAQGPKRWSRVRRDKTPSVDELLWLMTDAKAKKRFRKAKFTDVPDWTKWRVKL
jgi:hypothetical protein